MASGQSVELEGYRFTVKPASRFRRLTGDFWPYFQASRPSFVLSIERLDSSSKEQEARWSIRFSNDDNIGGKFTIPNLQEGEKIDFKIGKVFLGFTGDTLVCLPSDLISPMAPNYYTVYTFHTTPKSWLALAVSAAILAGIFAALGHWLLGLLD